MEEGEYCSAARYEVEADASLMIMSHCAVLRARMCEVAMDGCRVRAESPWRFPIPASVEVTFKINGTGFRLAGTLQAFDPDLMAAVRFHPLSDRRRQALSDMLAELDAVKNDPAVRENENAPAGRQAMAGYSLPVRAEVIELPAAPPKITRPEGESSPAVKPAAPAPPAVPIAQPCPAAGQDRRAETRQAVHSRATVFLIDVRAQISGRILDISMSGCRIRFDERFPVGIYRRVETEFHLDGLPFRLGGVVQAMHNKFTLGIRFLDMSTRKREQLQHLMQEIEAMKTAGLRD